ncbi:unnamed protein product [Lasius platythorax]|uniref:Uncharacterized protein n=1 Tax=Lasius platythorax TaxID=488582 RepID=A0AAV2NAQ2_9HYME
MISISVDRRFQLAGRVAGKRSVAVFVGTQLEIPVVVVVGSPDLNNPMMLQGARYIVGPDYYTRVALHTWKGPLVDCHRVHRSRAIIPPVKGGNPTVSLAAVLDAQEPSRTTATVPRNRPRQAALSSCRHSRVSHRESPPERPRRVVVVTSASINGTLDVTRRSNFPGKPLSQPRGTFALRLTDTRSAVDVDCGRFVFNGIEQCRFTFDFPLTIL